MNQSNYMSGMNIGLVAMAAKPLHAGHFELIKRAARENDEVDVYVSTGDRRRSGEFVITGDKMIEVWGILTQIIPENVNLHYVNNPIRAMWEQLEAENLRLASGDYDVANYPIYSDPIDIAANFPTSRLERYVQHLLQQNLLTLQPIARSSTVNISGTQMREWLKMGEKGLFMKHLPAELTPEQSEEIYNILAA